MNRYSVLKLELKNGDISDLTLQPRFELLSKGTNSKDEKYRKVEYVADFKYKDTFTGKWVVEDVKGMKTDVYKLKIKFFYAQYPHYYFMEI